MYLCSTSWRQCALVSASVLIALAGARTAHAQPACTYSVAPTSISAGAGASVGSVSVTASDPSCVWTATSDSP